VKRLDPELRRRLEEQLPINTTQAAELINLLLHVLAGVLEQDTQAAIDANQVLDAVWGYDNEGFAARSPEVKIYV
jgi:hypothetical protein